MAVNGGSVLRRAALAEEALTDLVVGCLAPSQGAAQAVYASSPLTLKDIAALTAATCPCTRTAMSRVANFPKEATIDLSLK